jgi:hypothetical protein
VSRKFAHKILGLCGSLFGRDLGSFLGRGGEGALLTIGRGSTGIFLTTEGKHPSGREVVFQDRLDDLPVFDENEDPGHRENTGAASSGC